MEHVPVMLSEAIEFLNVKPEGRYLDCTCGLGGHTRAIAEQLTTGRVLSLDRDAESLEKARANTAGLHDRIEFRQTEFSKLAEALQAAQWGPVDGVLADLGISRYQLTEPERGLSLMSKGPLDMRMNRQDELTAADVVNRATEQELSRIFVEFGEEKPATAQRLARAILRARPVRDTLQLAEVVATVIPRGGKIHPATRVFQSLRMVVNAESEELDAMLAAAPQWLKDGGRWVVIAFQSLDDRKVKNAFRDLAKTGKATVLTKHVVRPGPAETRRNPASRSAVLRALEMGARPGHSRHGRNEVEGEQR
jgi:16S rRNA (cytosine1402-N4)-methyltransferase